MKKNLLLAVAFSLLTVATSYSATSFDGSSATPASYAGTTSATAQVTAPISSSYFTIPAPAGQGAGTSYYQYPNQPQTAVQTQVTGQTLPQGQYQAVVPGQAPQQTQVPTQGQVPQQSQLPMQGQAPMQSQVPMQGQAPMQGQVPMQGQPGAQRFGLQGQNGNQAALTPYQQPSQAPQPGQEWGKQPLPQAGQQWLPPAEPSALEKAMGADPVTAESSLSQTYGVGQLTQYGYSFFRPEVSDPSSTQMDIPVGPDYVLGPGDRLLVTLWGSIEGTWELEVSRSGEIILPKVGAVKVAGQSFGQVPSLLKNTLARIFKDFQLNVNMGRLRVIKVYVVGEVTSPGDYNISSLSTLVNALAAAGGPTKSGSLRNIKINRNGKVLETVDLYDFFLNGDKGKDIRLQPGDTVLVPVIGQVAGIAGNVRRPGIYELKGESTLKDLLALCGGIDSTAYLQRVQMYRVQAHDKKMVTEIALEPGKNVEDATAGIKLQDLDLVKVLSIDTVLRGYVRLEGHVLRPGDYALKPGMRVSALLRGDNLLPEYHGVAGQITRLYEPDLHPEIVYFNVNRALSGEPEQDLELKEFDRVRIFSKLEMEEIPLVQVSGEVLRPGQYRYLENMTVRDLLMQAGNVKLSAYMKNAEIVRLKRADSGVVSYVIPVDLGAALKGDKENIKLQPFDELTVRRIPNWAEATDRYVTLNGEFVFPGTYPIYKGERLSSVVARAGGFSPLAYVKGARFTRESVRNLQQQRMDEALQKAQEDIINLQTNMAQTAASAEEVAAAKTTLDGLSRSVEILKTKRAEGRMLMEIASLDELKGGPYDLELQGGDQLTVPSDPGGVNVIGNVYNQSSVVSQQGRDVDWYLQQVGGPTGEADMSEIYVVKVNGSVLSQANSANFLFYNSFWGKDLDSGDTIIVPRQYERTAWLRYIKEITQILGNVAMTAGVVIAAGK